MLARFKKLLDSTTGYKVLIYCLLALAIIAIALSAAGTLNYSSPSVLIGMLTTLLVVCFVSDMVLGKLNGVTPANETSVISALILFFVLGAPSDLVGWLGVGFAGMVAMASKYVVTWQKAQVFNPAAFGVLVVGIMGIGEGVWWTANPVLFWPMLVVASIVLTKSRRWGLFIAFLLPALIILVGSQYMGNDKNVWESLLTAFTLYPLLFLGSIMLTEPATMPQTHNKVLVYGALVGVALATRLDILWLGASPHLALLIGNLFAWVVSSRASVSLELVSKTKLSPTTYSFEFKPSKPVKHAAGQYMDFTLPVGRPDSRGNRRPFTIASAPHAGNIRIGIKFYDNPSRFKQALVNLELGSTIFGNHVAGDFTLPRTTARPLVFVAGGIGVTPYVAMIEHMLHTRKNYQATLYYFAASQDEIVYTDTLLAAKQAGIKIVTKVGKGERLSKKDIAANKEAIFYLSGPPGLVSGYKTELKGAGVKDIRSDYFFGY